MLATCSCCSVIKLLYSHTYLPSASELPYLLLSLVDVALQAIERMSDFSAQNVSNLAYACAVRKHYNAPLYDALAARAVQLSHQLLPQHIANLVWSFAKQVSWRRPMCSACSFVLAVQ